MKRREAACPACGAPVLFEIGAAVAVCDFCQSAVGRGDKDVEDFGKVADIVDTSTRLRRGLSGRFNNKPFTIMGHVQYRHPAGGIWDEWYLALPNNKWGWLAEAQGKTHLMFERDLRKIELPGFEELDIGQKVRLGDTDFTVTERGTAETASAEGQIPWGFHPGAEHRFADLHSEDGTFATFEYGEAPRAFVGKEISLDDLQLEGPGWQLEEDKVSVEALQVNCPKCNGPLALRAPDHTLRVTCQNCNSLLDAESGKLSYLRTLKSRERFRAVIPLGSEGTLRGKKYTVIGFMQRYAVWEGKTFPWNEYLLYEPSVGFRWLVQNDGHWSFVEPVPQAAATFSYHLSTVRYKGNYFKVYDRGKAYVRYVTGEFYWRVEVGEVARTADFISPPLMLSGEWSTTDKSEEVNISLGTYLPVEELEKAFGLRNVRRPWGVGVIQPAPKMPKGVYLLWGLFLIVLLLTFVANAAKSDGWLCFYAMFFVSLVPFGYFGYRWSFEVKRWEDSDYSPYATE